MSKIHPVATAHFASSRVSQRHRERERTQMRGRARDTRPSGDSGDLIAHQRYLTAFARSRLGPDDEIEDLVQETLLAACVNKASFRGESTYRTWLTSVLVFKIADHRRRKDRASALSIEQIEEDQPGWLDRVAPPAEEPASPELADATRARVHAALGRLPANQRDAWLLAECNELPTATIERILGVSADNVWVLLHRARKRLREELIGMEVGA
ncbi:MAG: RNA polymerase sigma factor [Burkholderiales bacterium]|nr:RNA polymerase sigma factor [Burkholderiales bacterium]